MHFPSAHFADFLLRPKFHICSSHFLNICRYNERWSWWGCWWLWRWWSLHRHCFDHCLGWLAKFIWIGDEIFIGPFSRCFSHRGPFFHLSPLFVPSGVVFGWLACWDRSISRARSNLTDWNVTSSTSPWNHVCGLKFFSNSFYRYHHILITIIIFYCLYFGDYKSAL